MGECIYTTETRFVAKQMNKKKVIKPNRKDKQPI